MRKSNISLWTRIFSSLVSRLFLHYTMDIFLINGVLQKLKNQGNKTCQQSKIWKSCKVVLQARQQRIKQ